MDIFKYIDGSASFARLKDGALLSLSGDTFTGNLIPSADGRIFLMSSLSLQTRLPQKFSIVEIECEAAAE